MKSFWLCLLMFLALPTMLMAQRKNKKEAEKVSVDPDSSGIVSNKLLPTTSPLLLFDEQSKKEKKKKEKKKEKKNIYYGERTKKGRIRQNLREQVQFTFFNYTTQKQTVDPYVRDIYWYDQRDKMIRSKDFDPSRGVLLHGPFERIIGEITVEKGMYYFGTKHGTWMTFDNRSVLVDKGHYQAGWRKDSRTTYYDGNNKVIEKLTPIEYDLKEGNFYHFYENGQVAVIGEYQYGEKVGLWTEYWDTKNAQAIRKREIQYQEKPFTKNFRPYIRAEWDKEGNLIYRTNIASN
ncbi:MAG: toxin-antitoxin system YwqK family antitoxin [Belliella pelovolcani]